MPMKTAKLILHWAPRIICILAIGMLLMFGFDAFDPRLSLWQQILGFIMHSIPAFILTALLMASWKWELAGGIAFALIGIGLTPFIYTHNYQMNHSIGMSVGIVLLINFPFILTGALFIINHYVKKKQLRA
jgi:hypothetical protein